MTAEEGLAIAREEHERQERLDEKGLCFNCEENPQNPNINAKMCLDCWNNDQFMKCAASNCPNTAAGRIEQYTLCEVHLTDLIHQKYEEYLKEKSELKDKQKTFDEKVKKHNFNPKNYRGSPHDLSDIEQDIHGDYLVILGKRQNIKNLKREIQNAMKDLDQAFPENYKVFG